MFDQYKNINSKIQQITNAVKIFSLLFSGIAWSQYYFNNKSFFESLTQNFFGYLTIIIMFLALYVSLDYLDKKTNKILFLSKWVHAGTLIGVAFLSIMLTGGFQSNYKFLFLFVIISSSIELGMGAGLVISGITSVIVLGLDLLYAPSAIINTCFQSDIVLACAFLIIAMTVGFYVKIENDHISDLKDLVNVDGLTGLYNHRYFYECLRKLTEECKNNQKPLSLLFIDIDYFKHYNDANGHQKGDEALIAISFLLKRSAREKDIVARYGGEEFAIILPDTSENEALDIAEILRSAVQEHSFAGQEYLPNHNLTISVGVSVFPTKAKTEDEIIRFADEALYRAKSFRKNRVEAYSSILDDLKNDVAGNDKEIVASIKTLIAVINAKDKYTFRHVERVVIFCDLMSDVLKLDDRSRKNFIYSAYMHDIGKINIPEEILMKSTPLDPEEWAMLQKHPESGAEIVKNVLLLKDVVPIILQHHEKYDGSGYPNHLKGEEITYLARVLNVIDSFDAMTSFRPYQKKKSYSQAFDELIKCSGTQFDPEIVKVFIASIKDDSY